MTRLSPLIKSIPALLDRLTTCYIIGLAAYLFLRLLLGDRLWWLALLNNFTIYYFLPLLIFLPLAALLRRWTTLARLIPLVFLAALWYAPYYLPKVQAALDTLSFKIVTFNVAPFNRTLDDVYLWLRTTNADVVLLQEVPGQLAEHGIPELLEPYPHQTTLPTGVPDAPSWGNLAISRYPLLSEAGFDLEDDGSPTHQRITLDIAGRTIAVYNIHLLMPISEKPRWALPSFLGKFEFALKYDDSARNAQIERLLALLQNETLPYIVAGDFNMSDQSVIYSTLAAVMSDSFREAGIGFGASWPSGESEELPDVFPPLLRVDYLWHSEDIRALQAALGPKLGSDHLPLVGEFGFFRRPHA